MNNEELTIKGCGVLRALFRKRQDNGSTIKRLEDASTVGR
jgi:hypothetical protein